MPTNRCNKLCFFGEGLASNCSFFCCASPTPFTSKKNKISLSPFLPLQMMVLSRRLEMKRLVASEQRGKVFWNEHAVRKLRAAMTPADFEKTVRDHVHQELINSTSYISMELTVEIGMMHEKLKPPVSPLSFQLTADLDVYIKDKKMAKSLTTYAPHTDRIVAEAEKFIHDRELRGADPNKDKDQQPKQPAGPPVYQELPAAPAEPMHKKKTTPFTGHRQGAWVKVELPPFVGNVAEGRKVRIKKRGWNSSNYNYYPGFDQKYYIQISAKDHYFNSVVSVALIKLSNRNSLYPPWSLCLQNVWSEFSKELSRIAPDLEIKSYKPGSTMWEVLLDKEERVADMLRWLEGSRFCGLRLRGSRPMTLFRVSLSFHKDVVEAPQDLMDSIMERHNLYGTVQVNKKGKYNLFTPRNSFTSCAAKTEKIQFYYQNYNCMDSINPDINVPYTHPFVFQIESKDKIFQPRGAPKFVRACAVYVDAGVLAKLINYRAANDSGLPASYSAGLSRAKLLFNMKDAAKFLDKAKVRTKSKNKLENKHVSSPRRNTVNINELKNLAPFSSLPERDREDLRPAAGRPFHRRGDGGNGGSGGRGEGRPAAAADVDGPTPAAGWRSWGGPDGMRENKCEINHVFIDILSTCCDQVSGYKIKTIERQKIEIKKIHDRPHLSR